MRAESWYIHHLKKYIQLIQGIENNVQRHHICKIPRTLLAFKHETENVFLKKFLIHFEENLIENDIVYIDVDKILPKVKIKNLEKEEKVNMFFLHMYILIPQKSPTLQKY